MPAIDLERTNEPQFAILIWEDGRHVGSHSASDGLSARRCFAEVVARSKASPLARRVELYDGPDLIDSWPGEEG